MHTDLLLGIDQNENQNRPHFAQKQLIFWEKQNRRFAAFLTEIKN